MTICIGVRSDARHPDGPCIILSADNKAVRAPTVVDRVAGKLHDFYPTCPNLGAAIAGGISACNAVVGVFEKALRDFAAAAPTTGQPLAIDHVRIAIKYARQLEFEKFADEEMRGLLGMSIADWQKRRNPETRRKGFTVMRAARRYFPVYLIFGSYIGDHWLLMESRGASVINGGEPHYAIGYGDAAAYRSLHRRKHDGYTPWPAALVQVAEAMEAARRKAPRYIGKPADYLVMRRDKPMMRFPWRSPLLAQWLKRGTRVMGDSEELRRQFEAELLPHITANR